MHDHDPVFLFATTAAGHGVTDLNIPPGRGSTCSVFISVVQCFFFFLLLLQFNSLNAVESIFISDLNEVNKCLQGFKDFSWFLRAWLARIHPGTLPFPPWFPDQICPSYKIVSLSFVYQAIFSEPPLKAKQKCCSSEWQWINKMQQTTNTTTTAAVSPSPQ